MGITIRHRSKGLDIEIKAKHRNKGLDTEIRGLRIEVRVRYGNKS